MVYKWKHYGYSIPAEVVGKHFEKLEKKEGGLTSQNVLESARSEKSPNRPVTKTAVRIEEVVEVVAIMATTTKHVPS